MDIPKIKLAIDVYYKNDVTQIVGSECIHWDDEKASKINIKELKNIAPYVLGAFMKGYYLVSYIY
ncbi:MAG: hypothetical protein HRT68_00580 [Flavobacteriaceae bacterium]|nr:hypothetical protein [Flavobacteriaceae bacterium]